MCDAFPIMTEADIAAIDAVMAIGNVEDIDYSELLLDEDEE
jgi:hypothetical protein